MSAHVARALEAVHRSGQKAYGFWGNHTATIDWCEDNYTHTQYIAEWYNTVSNIPFIALGLYGAYYSLTEIPSAMHRSRFAAPHFGIAFVGLGSFIFHATLNWYAQVLLDEMPMIYVSSMVLYLVFAPTDGSGSWKLKLGITSVPFIITVLYLIFPYPVIHQVCFAGIMLSIGYRLVGLIRNPEHKQDAISDAKYYIITGALMFALAFGIWNIDNTFCDFWTMVRTRLWGDEAGPSFRTPSLSAAVVGAVTQGHAWWHLLTGLGCARMAAGASYLMLTTSHPDMFVLYHPMIGIVPSVRRSPEFERPEVEEYLLGDRLIISIYKLRRFSTLPGSPAPPPSLITQITRNMDSLRTSILDMEVEAKGREEVRPLREQWERMRKMVEGQVNIDSLPPVREPTPPPPPSPHAPKRKPSDDAIFRPYKDEPAPYEDEGPSHDDILLQQRQMIDEQDSHLDRLSHSIRNQHDISLQINDELEVHTGLLEALDHELDSTGDRLSRARRRLDHVARGARDNGSAVAIGVLIFVLLILIVVFKT
ncbi:unnamed protein product [Rhizoctonia solani]|uniref:t-SNARE coiled-coil homology domain-containing protein n=1 Tax=Rhizoctonia solani TaxID=456999 RepID=A0A8H2XG22_9AGAM|nr:unnamed protein product [Rhizoctonia solani]